MNQINIFICLLIPLISFSQEDVYIDKRDGNEYPLVKIGEYWWFGENLKFESTYSHCPNFNKKDKDCDYGNYYPFSELDIVCPNGFHVATVNEWEAYVTFLCEQNNVLLDNLVRDSIFYDFPSLYVEDSTASINFLANNNILNLENFGWVQGFRKQRSGSPTIWIRDEITKNSKTHIHLWTSNYVQHFHDKNITDTKIKLNRKFCVRCVKDY